VGTALSLVFMGGLALGAAGYLAAPALLDVVRMPVEVRGDALAYLRTVCLGMPVQFLLILMNMMTRGSGIHARPSSTRCCGSSWRW
jgi:Na+-driven multidrug efflux pump